MYSSVCTLSTKVSVKAIILSTIVRDRFSVLEMHLRYAHKKTMSLCFNIANPGIATNVVKD